MAAFRHRLFEREGSEITSNHSPRCLSEAGFLALGTGIPTTDSELPRVNRRKQGHGCVYLFGHGREGKMAEHAATGCHYRQGRNALYGIYTNDVKTVAIMMHDALRSYASTKRVNRRDAGGARIRDCHLKIVKVPSPSR
jgi:hypothetical protein